MATRVRESLGSSPVFKVLLISGLVGILMGFDTARLQISVETGQVLAGLVNYPPGNPNLLYHLKVFSIVNYLSALLLLVTDSEVLTSFIIASLVGMVLFQALSMFIFAINRDIYLAVLFAFIIIYKYYSGFGMVYSIMFLGSPHTFGVIGLAFIVLVVALIGAGSFPLALFCLGLAPSVHPSLACWLYLLIILSMLLSIDFSKRIIKDYYIYFIIGFAISLASLGFQLYLMRDMPEVDAELKSRLFNNYIRYWDFHRIKFFWNYPANTYHIFHPAYLFAIISALAGLLGLKHFREDRSLRFIFKLLIIAGPLSLLFGLLTHISPENLPDFLIAIMPGRFVNLSSVLLIPMLLGMLTFYFKERGSVNYTVVTIVVLLLYFFVPGMYANLRVFRIYTMFFTLVCIFFVFVFVFSVSKNLMIRGARELFLSRARELLRMSRLLFVLRGLVALRYVIVIPLIVVFAGKSFKEIFIERSYLVDRTTVEMLSVISNRDGMLLVTDGFYMTALKTRRPVLFDVSALDGMAMVPQGLGRLNEITKKIYGVDLSTTLPPVQYRNTGTLPVIFYKDMWRYRTLREWQEIRREFGVTDVMTKAGWNLRLPVVFEFNGIVLYEIPSG